jgi:hypothetical protein
LVREGWAKVGKHVEELSLNGVRPKLDWFDLYASADPVSNGRLMVVGIEGSRPVTNLMSGLLDHTSYWKDQAEFIPEVLHESTGARS